MFAKATSIYFNYYVSLHVMDVFDLKLNIVRSSSDLGGIFKRILFCMNLSISMNHYSSGSSITF